MLRKKYQIFLLTASILALAAIFLLFSMNSGLNPYYSEKAAANPQYYAFTNTAVDYLAKYSDKPAHNSLSTELYAALPAVNTSYKNNVEQRFANYPVLYNYRSEADEQGYFKISKVYQTNMKYPNILVEERFQQIGSTVKALGISAMSADHLIVGLKEGQTLANFEEPLLALNASVIKSIDSINAHVIQIPLKSATSLRETIEHLNGLNELVDYAEPDFVAFHTGIPNDNRFGEQWALNNNGTFFGAIPDADIDAPEAWDITTADTSTIIAIIDTGIDPDHNDLKSNLYQNPNEIPDNGIDDDNNGFEDDISGWNFVDFSSGNNPYDDDGHGTHVSGIAAATGNNNTGIIGVAPNARILPLKALDAEGSGFVTDIADAIDYAIDIKATVVNMSLSGPDPSRLTRNAITRMEQAGILLTASAGNDGADNAIFPNYPADYENPNIISVASTDWDDQLSEFSSFNAVSVDVAAPGGLILSTVPGNNYESLDGTSMSAPHVAGLVALIKSINPQFDSNQIKQTILDTTDPSATLSDKILTGGRINAFKATQLAQKSNILIHGNHISLRSILTNNFATINLGNANQISADDPERNLLSVFEVTNAPGNLIALRSVAIGQFLSTGEDGFSPIAATQPSAAESEWFLPIWVTDEIIALQAHSNGAIVTTGLNGLQPLQANRNQVTQSEHFFLEIAHPLRGGDIIALRNLGTGSYVVGSDTLYADGSDITEAALFEVEELSKIVFALKSQISGKYITTNIPGDGNVSATSPTIGNDEQLLPVYQGEGIITLRSAANTLFLSAESTNTELMANAGSISPFEQFEVIVVSTD